VKVEIFREQYELPRARCTCGWAGRLWHNTRDARREGREHAEEHERSPRG